MPTTKISPFKFENISLETGQCEVRFINKYGPIYTGQKTIEDYVKIVQAPTGNFTQEGVEITELREVITDSNPNGDFIYSFDIPVDANGNFISEEELIEYIGEQYPHDIFDDIERRKNAPKTLNVASLTSSNIKYEKVIPDPVIILDVDPWDALRRKRNEILAQTDWTQIPDATPPGSKAQWEIYRNALRDLPQNTVDPLKPDWPVPPIPLSQLNSI